MNKKFKCPMMCGAHMMHQPEHMMMEPEIPMLETEDMDLHYQDEEDDRKFMKMYPESCKKMMVFVKVEIDRMEELDEMIHEDQPEREMINIMADNAYNEMVKEMPEMAEEEERQYPGRRFSRDLLRVLLLNELFRRRRRRRRRLYYDYPYGGYDYDYYY